MKVQTLLSMVTLMIRDVNQGEYTTAQLLLLLQSAAWDFRDGGWLLRMEDDESIVVVANTPEYDVPADFAYVQDLYLERTLGNSSDFSTQIPRGHWDIRLNDNGPQFVFYTQSFLDVGKNVKIVGQKRPTIYTDLNQDVDVGMIVRLRERVKFYARMGMAPGNSELARMRYTTAVTERQLERPYPPKTFRQLPGAKPVPGRE